MARAQGDDRGAGGGRGEITPAHISKIESGKGGPSVALLKKLARVLRVDMEVLVGGTTG